MQELQRRTRTILVVDDSEVVLEMMRLTLETAGFRVLTRDRAAGSVAAILHERPDLVLLDVNMPQMSGDSIADILARTGPARGTLIILHSSLPAHALRMKALTTGAHGFIQKTSIQADLIRQIRAFLRHSGGSAFVSEEVAASSTRIRVARVVADAVSESVPVEPPASGPQPTLPALTSASAPPTPCDSGSLPLTLPTTLFLDDDITVLTAYRRAFSSEELIGEYLTSAEQALRRIIGPQPPDVVCTDLVLPGMNGIELYRRVLELDPTWRHRFVFVTGAATLGYVAEFLRQVGGRALQKPVEIGRLRDAIRYSATGARIFRKHAAEGR